MTTDIDGRGLAISASSEAAGFYREGVDLLLSAWPGADEALDAAIASDPSFALAHAARARLHAVRAEPIRARAAIAAARACLDLRGSDREASHVDVLSLAIDGRTADALARALAHLESWPRDALILSLPLGAFGLLAFSGMADHDQARVDLCERHAAQYGDEDWWFLTYRGWAHVENGESAKGRGIVERAFGLRRRNANAAHALSHAMFEDGAGREADALIADWLPGYGRSGPLHGHVCWHQALSALDEGDGERALGIYREHIRPAANSAVPLNVVSDGASFLWRLQAYGHAVPHELWTEVAAYADDAFPRAGLAFVDVHMALLAAATGDKAGLARRRDALMVESAARPATSVALAIAQAVLAFAEEDYAACVQQLDPAIADLARIGGSHAQREVVEDTLLVALIRSGETGKARACLDRRLHRRPSPRDSRWLSGLVG